MEIDISLFVRNLDSIPETSSSDFTVRIWSNEIKISIIEPVKPVNISRQISDFLSSIDNSEYRDLGGDCILMLGIFIEANDSLNASAILDNHVLEKLTSRNTQLEVTFYPTAN